MAMEESGGGLLPAELAAVVARQVGVLTRRQCLTAGLTETRIGTRVRSGRWQRLYPGILLVHSGPVPRAAALWAAVLYAGPGAMLSHESAGELWGICPPNTSAVTVTVPHRRTVAQQPGLVIHRSTRADEIRHPGRLPPRTRVEETAVALAEAAGSAEQAINWLTAACAQRLTTPDRLWHTLRRHQRVRWRTVLESALGEVAAGCQSPLERWYLRGVERAHGLPPADRQVRITAGVANRFEDVRYRQWGLVVELDGRVTHAGGQRWRDHTRDNAVVVSGGVTLRFGWSDVVDQACEVAAQVALVLRARGWPGRLRPCGPRCRATPDDPPADPQ